nr:hypothetical protein [Streptomyces triticiradicis]
MVRPQYPHASRQQLLPRRYGPEVIFRFVTPVGEDAQRGQGVGVVRAQHAQAGIQKFLLRSCSPR